MWRILRAHGVTEKHLKTAAKNAEIKYNDFVDLEGGLERLITELNRLGYNLALHVDVFDYLENYYPDKSKDINAGPNNINIALIFDPIDGLGHYVEEIQ